VKPLERVMRLMTHLNIAATLATAAWVLWSGSQIVAGTGPWPGGQAMRSATASHVQQQTSSISLARPHIAQGDGMPCHEAASPTPTHQPATPRGTSWHDT
jgi:hypothetical protein